MAKRLTDTTIWDRNWFRVLTPKMKEAYRYLFERCDHAGIWDVDMATMSHFINEPVTELELKECLGDKIQYLKPDKILVLGFIDAQYKCSIEDLNPANKVHQSVINLLKKHGVCKPLASPLQGSKDKDKYKDKDKDKEKEGVPKILAPPTFKEFDELLISITEKPEISDYVLSKWAEVYGSDYGRLNVELNAMAEWHAEHTSKKKTPKLWRACAKNWVENSFKAKSGFKK
jgi:hypothetical protein